MNLLDLSEAEMIAFLEKRGYVISHSSYASVILTWNRMLPFPDGCDFEKEAVQKLAEQIKPEHIRFETRRVPSLFVTGHGDEIRTDEIRTAKILIMA